MNIEFDWVKPQRGRGNSFGAPSAGGVRIYSTLSKCKDRKEEHQTCVRLGVDVMRAFRLVVGDRIIIGEAEKDGKKYMAIQRVPGDADGFKLSNPGGKTKNGSVRDYGVAKMRYREWPKMFVPLSAIKANGSGFFFCLDDAEVTHDQS